VLKKLPGTTRQKWWFTPIFASGGGKTQARGEKKPVGR
jgi:hypothetical protein